MLLLNIKTKLKLFTIINLVGIPLVSVSLMVYSYYHPFAWSDIVIALNLLISIPCFISNLIIGLNIKKPNEEIIQRTLIVKLLVLWIPSIALPLFYEIGGLIISLIILGVGLVITIKVHKVHNKMMFINLVGIFFLIVNCYIVSSLISQGV